MTTLLLSELTWKKSVKLFVIEKASYEAFSLYPNKFYNLKASTVCVNSNANSFIDAAAPAASSTSAAFC